MNNLVHTLEAQHRSLEKLAQEVETALAAKNGEVLPERLTRLGNALQAHLGLENAQFYPQFEKLAVVHGRPQDLEVARLFSSNMKLIADGLAQFLMRYQKPPADLVAFERDWRATLKILGQRIASEEHTLHPMFAKLAE